MNFEILNDQELYNLIRANNEHAFKELYNRYWKVLYNSAFKRLADEYLVEEIVQETFINLYLKKEDIIIKETLAPYLHTVVKFKVIDQIRKKVVEDNYKNTLFSNTVHATISSDDLLERKELIELFNQFIETLPTKCKDVFALKRKEYSNKEIAQKLNISEKTVEGHVSLARKRMINFFKSAFVASLIITLFKLY